MPFPMSFEGEFGIPSRDGIPLDLEEAYETLDRCIEHPHLRIFVPSMYWAGTVQSAKTSLASDGSGGLVLQYRVNTADMVILGGFLAAGIGGYVYLGGAGPLGIRAMTSIGIAAVVWPLLFSSAYFITKVRFFVWLEGKVGPQLRSPG